MPERLLVAPSFQRTKEPKGQRPALFRSRADAFGEQVKDRLAGMSDGQRLDLDQRTKATVFEKGCYIKQPSEDGQGEVNQAVPIITLPKFFDRETMNAHAADVTAVYGVMERIEELALDHDSKLGKEIFAKIIQGMSDEESELILRARNRPEHTARRRNARADAFINPGGMDIMEINNSNPEGLNYHHVLTKSANDFLDEIGVGHEDLDPLSGSAAHQVHAMLLDEYADHTGGELPKRVGIVYEQEKEDGVVNRAELPFLGELFSKEFDPTFDVVHGDPKDVEAENGRMTVKGKEVDIIWRNAIDVPAVFHEAPGMVEVMSHPETYPILNDQTSSLIGSKIMLSFLHDERVQAAVGMTPAERQAVLRTVPFTFTPGEGVYLEVDGKRMSSEEYLIRYQEHFVLKPGTGTHGEKLYFGVHTNNGWAEGVQHAVETGTFVAQRYVDYAHSTELVHSIAPDGKLAGELYVRDTNLHHIDGQATGTSISRIVPATGEVDILNVAAGGGLQGTRTL